MGRSSIFAASSSPMICSFSGSHWTFRPVRMAISESWPSALSKSDPVVFS